MTWISPDGQVLYDSDMAASQMENHLEREEVQAALRKGYGESQRYSGTMTVKMLYSAQRLADGSVLRLSMPQQTILMVIWDMALPIGFILLVVIGVSVAIAARETKKANQEETEAMRREFTANVSHELKTPLTSISGVAEIIKNGIVADEDIPKFAGNIYSDAQRLIRLVEDIIRLSQLDEGKNLPVKEELDLYYIALDVANQLEDVADKRNINIDVKGKSATFMGIKPVIQEIVYNLCDNAIKYNYDNGKVTINVDSAPQYISITVEDTGIGIPEDQQERIFERFYRVDKSHSREVGGTGLGLSIVKHGVKLHNGRINIDSKPEKGTKISITFPV